MVAMALEKPSATGEDSMDAAVKKLEDKLRDLDLRLKTTAGLQEAAAASVASALTKALEAAFPIAPDPHRIRPPLARAVLPLVSAFCAKKKAVEQLNSQQTRELLKAQLVSLGGHALWTASGGAAEEKGGKRKSALVGGAPSSSLLPVDSSLCVLRQVEKEEAEAFRHALEESIRKVADGVERGRMYRILLEFTLNDFGEGPRSVNSVYVVRLLSKLNRWLSGLFEGGSKDEESGGRATEKFMSCLRAVWQVMKTIRQRVLAHNPANPLTPRTPRSGTASPRTPRDRTPRSLLARSSTAAPSGLSPTRSGTVGGLGAAGGGGTLPSFFQRGSTSAQLQPRGSSASGGSGMAGGPGGAAGRGSAGVLVAEENLVQVLATLCSARRLLVSRFLESAELQSQEDRELFRHFLAQAAVVEKEKREERIAGRRETVATGGGGGQPGGGASPRALSRSKTTQRISTVTVSDFLKERRRTIRQHQAALLDAERERRETLGGMAGEGNEAAETTQEEKENARPAVVRAELLDKSADLRQRLQAVVGKHALEDVHKEAKEATEKLRAALSSANLSLDPADKEREKASGRPKPAVGVPGIRSGGSQQHLGRKAKGVTTALRARLEKARAQAAALFV
uniref:Uncharacterized protein n=1 Tax=Chromera velia CCMP2878 TaxID=1169474 RepID=A0A0G4HK10_9ALVE|eukprot:Cvel_7142.t1-p1 / transcript=Cvel_7142.t1 / gene=Cvel_7142 / organism=Chromera_velia_CCMP2878 / gene_product=hypothetical protein / transcript_product=hypothetical protein / location=Cvel_scaffold367:348-5692(+) / protein_length=625 / sequence_SO=supercontig / SO=protein_coding / is_pseudo=false